MIRLLPYEQSLSGFQSVQTSFNKSISINVFVQLIFLSFYLCEPGWKSPTGIPAEILIGYWAVIPAGIQAVTVISAGIPVVPPVFWHIAFGVNAGKPAGFSAGLLAGITAEIYSKIFIRYYLYFCSCVSSFLTNCR